MLFWKILCDVNYCAGTFSEQLETVLVQTIGAHLNYEPQTPWLCSISNAAHLSLKLLLSGRPNTSNNWLHDLFLNENSNISPMIFH